MNSLDRNFHDGNFPDDNLQCLHPVLACAPPLPIMKLAADDLPPDAALIADTGAANDNTIVWPIIPFPDGWCGSN